MALLVLIHEGLTVNKIPIDKDEIRIGRLPEADIFLDDKMVSHTHAKIERVIGSDKKDDDAFFLEDLGSTNHTFVNGKIIDRVKLVNDDTIRIGKHIFKFIDESALGGEKTTKLRKSWIPGVYYTKE